MAFNFFFKQKKSSIHLLEKEQPKKLDKGSRKEDYGGLSYAPNPRLSAYRRNFSRKTASIRMDDPLSSVFLKEKEFGHKVGSTQKKIKRDLVTASQRQIMVVGTLRFYSTDLDKSPLFRVITAQLGILSLTQCTSYTCCFSI
mgnify:CR=1 FL=1